MTEINNNINIDEWDKNFYSGFADIYFEEELKKTKTIKNEEERILKKKLYQKILLVFKHTKYLYDCIEYGEYGSLVLKGIYNRNIAVKDAMRLIDKAVKNGYWNEKQYTDCRKKFIHETKYFNKTCDTDDII